LVSHRLFLLLGLLFISISVPEIAASDQLFQRICCHAMRGSVADRARKAPNSRFLRLFVSKTRTRRAMGTHKYTKGTIPATVWSRLGGHIGVSQTEHSGTKP